MSLPSPTSVLNLPKSYLAAQLAACAKWQELCAINGAVASIYYDDLPPPPDQAEAYTVEQLTALRPLCVIYSDEDTGLSFDHQSHGPQGFGYRDSGTLKGYFESAVPDELRADRAGAVRMFENDLGTVIAQLLALSGQAGYLAISSANFQGPLRCHEDQVPTEGDYLQLRFTFTWGRR